jgi:hypothetical protein
MQDMNNATRRPVIPASPPREDARPAEAGAEQFPAPTAVLRGSLAGATQG